MTTRCTLPAAGRVREGGQKIHPSCLPEVKTHAESRGPGDYLKVVATTSAEGGCSLVRSQRFCSHG